MPVRMRVSVTGRLPRGYHGRALRSVVLDSVRDVAPWVAHCLHEQTRPAAYSLTEIQATGRRDEGVFEVGVWDDLQAEAVLHALDSVSTIAPCGCVSVITRIDAVAVDLGDIAEPTARSVGDLERALTSMRGRPAPDRSDGTLPGEWTITTSSPMVLRVPDGSPPISDEIEWLSRLLDRAAERASRLSGEAVDRFRPTNVRVAFDRFEPGTVQSGEGVPGEPAVVGSWRIGCDSDGDDNTALNRLMMSAALLGLGDRTPVGCGAVDVRSTHWQRLPVGIRPNLGPT